MSEIKDGYIKRVRFKTEVYGQWQLWQETQTGIDWWMKRRPESELKYLLLTRKGKQLTEQTAGNNRKQTLANSWNYLHQRIVKDHPSFRKLSFNKLRKTASDLIKDVADGETAGVFLTHGQTVETDHLADVYTNRKFGKVFAAQEKVYAKLAPMFASVDCPFPDDYAKTTPHTSLGTIKRIHSLHAQGYTVSKIAELTGVTVKVVRYQLRKKQ